MCRVKRKTVECSSSDRNNNVNSNFFSNLNGKLDQRTAILFLSDLQGDTRSYFRACSKLFWITLEPAPTYSKSSFSNLLWVGPSYFWGNTLALLHIYHASCSFCFIDILFHCFAGSRNSHDWKRLHDILSSARSHVWETSSGIVQTSVPGRGWVGPQMVWLFERF